VKNKYADFYNYTEDQFVENERFQHWIKYEDKVEEEFWNGYIQLFPKQLPILLTAKKRVVANLALQKMQPLSRHEKLLLKKSIFQRIQQPLQLAPFIQQKSMQLLKFAAIVMSVLITPMYLINKQPKSGTLLIKRTGNKQTKEFVLPDSSIVILNANSSITYNKEINNIQNREISLQGNAFFRVKKKVGHNLFTVHANTLDITVLGTEFNVNARTGTTAIVLTKGSVKVSLANKNTTAVYMAPGEKVQVDTTQKLLIKSATNPLLYGAWTEGKWNFASTSLLNITNLLYEYYGIETVYNNEQAKYLKVTAVIPITDLGSLINILVKTLNIKIIEKNNKLLVQI